MSILVINSGSSSLKFHLFEGESLESRVSGSIDRAEDDDSASVSIRYPGKGKSSKEEKIPGYWAAIKRILRLLEKEICGIAAIGHRIVHGGARFCDNVLVEKKDYYRYERSAGSFTRSFQLPEDVQSDKAKAKFKDGVLEIKIPMTEEAKKKEKKLEIE